MISNPYDEKYKKLLEGSGLIYDENLGITKVKAFINLLSHVLFSFLLALLIFIGPIVAVCNLMIFKSLGGLIILLLGMLAIGLFLVTDIIFLNSISKGRIKGLSIIYMQDLAYIILFVSIIMLVFSYMEVI